MRGSGSGSGSGSSQQRCICEATSAIIRQTIRATAPTAHGHATAATHAQHCVLTHLEVLLALASQPVRLRACEGAAVCLGA
jgi:hypothetical protein